MSLFDVVSDVSLKILHAINPQHEPKLQCSESSSQWDLPVLSEGNNILLQIFFSYKKKNEQHLPCNQVEILVYRTLGTGDPC